MFARNKYRTICLKECCVFAEVNEYLGEILGDMIEIVLDLENEYLKNKRGDMSPVFAILNEYLDEIF